MYTKKDNNCQKIFHKRIHFYNNNVFCTYRLMYLPIIGRVKNNYCNKLVITNIYTKHI